MAPSQYLNLLSISTLTYVLNTATLFVTTNLPHLSLVHPFTEPTVVYPSSVPINTHYTTDPVLLNRPLYMQKMVEFSNSIRYTRFSNPLVSYDYKCGHYLGI